MASNPVFNQFNRDLAEGRVDRGRPQYGQYASPQQLEAMYAAPSATPAQTGRMTLDDVLTKTLVLFGILVVTGAVGWVAGASNPPLGRTLWLTGMLGGLVLGLVIAFKKTISVPLIIGYAALEGLFVGACSQAFNANWSGVVAQAVLATLCVFAAMFVGWRTGLIKVTARSRRILGLLMLGYLIFALVNLVLLWTGVLHGWGVGGSGPLGLVISVLAVALASYSIVTDFDSIQNGVRAGLPEKYGWLMAHGLIVSVVWLYVELLRLFARMRD